MIISEKIKSSKTKKHLLYHVFTLYFGSKRIEISILRNAGSLSDIPQDNAKYLGWLKIMRAFL